MDRVFSTLIYDYFEVSLESDILRLVYGFRLEGLEGDVVYYYGERFFPSLPLERNDCFKFPYNRKEDLPTVPSWLKDAIFYNIFPDSFITSPREENSSMMVRGVKVDAHHGGKLIDVINKLGYIKSLGCNAIYFNPFFLARSYHKYDTVDYMEIDPLIGNEEEAKRLLREAHKKGIRIIVDGVFNHSGTSFFAFQDVLKNQAESPYKDWFYHLSFPVVYPPKEGERPNYACFGYEKEMPKLNTSNQGVIDYFKRVVDKWIGEFGFDGFRFDTADEVNDRFWEMIHEEMRKINPESVLIGEMWQNPAKALKASEFDGAMNYDFRRAVLGYLKEEKDAEWLDGYFAYILTRTPTPYTEGMMNLLSTHDVPRTFTLLNEDVTKMKIAFVLLYTFIGSVSLFYGDENGFTGLREDEYRRPMEFPDHPLFLDLIQSLSSLRSSHHCFREGNYKTLAKDGDMYVYERSDEKEGFIIALQPSLTPKDIRPFLEHNSVVLSSGLQEDGSLLHGFAIIKKL